MLVERVRVGRLKDFIAPEHGEQILVADIFDLMSMQGGDGYELGRFARYAKFRHSLVANAVRENKAPPVSGEEGVESLDVAMRCLESRQPAKVASRRPEPRRAAG